MFSLSFSSVTVDCTKRSPPFVCPSSLVTYFICSIIFEKDRKMSHIYLYTFFLNSGIWYKDRYSSGQMGPRGNILYTYLTIGHCRVPKTVTFKTRLSAKPFLLKISSLCMRIKRSFSYHRLHTKPRFDTEAWGNSKMAF